jgi:3'-phosphoadenosine 5'-phosphosulfate sulfotransferase (PAPS reductase)/FAD synthetase
MPTMQELKILQALDYKTKNRKRDLRIVEWVEHWGVNSVAVSASGGLDSNVLLHSVRKLYPDVRAVGIPSIECKENQRITNEIENFVSLKPQYSRVEIIEKFGYPIGSKRIAKSLRRLQNPTEKNLKSRNLALTGITSDGRESKRFKLSEKWIKFIDSPFKVSEQCCYYMKEKPLHDYAKENDIHYFVGTKAEDSLTRQSAYLGTGCNSFKDTGNSMPLGIWTHQDVLIYTVVNDLPVSEAYGEIIEVNTRVKASKEKLQWLIDNNKPLSELTTTKAGRTGCFICAFGLHMERQPNRFQRMEVEDPKLYDFAINKLGYGPLLDFAGVPYRMEQMPRQIEFSEQMSLLNVI